MVVTEHPHNDAQPSSKATLTALTAAALALPGLLPMASLAADQEVGLQYGHYQESSRNLFGEQSKFKPIEVDSLEGSTSFKLSDRVKFGFNYVQDTWSGATPITTAPLAFGGNGGYTGANEPTVSGATPYINGELFFDSQLNPMVVDGYDPNTGDPVYKQQTQLVHTLSSASPETRKQGDFKLGYEWDEAALDAGGGLSVENDYNTHWGSLDGRMDFNQKQTTASLGLSYTDSTTTAKQDHDTVGYINTNAYQNQIEHPAPGVNILNARRQDWGTHFGLTQVLNKSAVLETGVGYTRSTGYLANPYKVMEIAFIDPGLQFLAPSGGYYGQVKAFMEQRPEERNQVTTNLRYVQHIAPLDAALHLDYRFYHDDWGINAHTFEGDWVQPLGQGWTITPSFRYYSQSAANFYKPYLISQQAYQGVVIDPNTGAIIGNTQYDPNLLPSSFSSDYRLSGYGALSGGLTISKQFAKGISFVASAEYYTHAGSLKLGGNGEGNYADFNYYTVSGAVKVDLSAVATASGGHAGHSGHSHHHSPVPSGVMFGHMLSKPGDVMLGARYMYGSEGGNRLHGTTSVNDQTIVTNGCGNTTCSVVPSEMNMNMIMVDLMYAPTDWLNLMLMPQFMDMNMNLRPLDGAPPSSGGHNHGGGNGYHDTGGIGDTGIYALFKLFDGKNHHLHSALGISAPTGDVDIKLRDTHHEEGDYIHYGMQLGSGTWDFKPSITYTGQMDKWSWGAQLSGTKRLDNRNASGYALGDLFQSTAWGSYNIFDWLSASVRGVYTWQGAIKGQFNQHLVRDKEFTVTVPGDADGDGVIAPGEVIETVEYRDAYEPYVVSGPMDLPYNYGGRYWDVGFGLNAVVLSGDLQGNSLSFEWLQPVSDDVNGYQLERQGALSVNWDYAF
ncbi:MAG: DUF3570 domain-containing protein [Methylococcales bacterium]|nr:DUF3570 domain-containing protein [Methylococcales bacterium]